MNFETQARKGAELLDQHMPGWEDQIDLATLDGVSTNDCILGQLFGHYFDGCRRLFPEIPPIPFLLQPESFAHGFAMFSRDEVFMPQDSEQERETRKPRWLAAWTGEITKRRSERRELRELCAEVEQPVVV